MNQIENQKKFTKLLKEQIQLINNFIQQKGTVFGKSFHIIDSPQIISKICDIRMINSNKIKPQLKTITQRFASKTSNLSHPYKRNQQRGQYQKLKNEVQTLLQKIDNCQNLNLSDIMLYKQQILGSFLGNFVQQIKGQCRQRGDLLDLIWKQIFFLLQKVLKSISHQKQEQQKLNLIERISSHSNYQQFIQGKQKDLQKTHKQLEFTNSFNNTLVYNLRIKKKEIKHLYGQIKICTDKLNQYKSYYLDLQGEHIQLLMQNKEISRDNAIYLLKRKHQILADKKKAFKLKCSQKNNMQIIKDQLKKQRVQEKNKIQQQVRQLFAKQFQQKKAMNSSFPKLSNFLFEEALQDFNYYSIDYGNDQIVNLSSKTTFVEVGTDMFDMNFGGSSVQTQVEYIDKIVHQLSKNRGDQTMSQDKAKAKKIAQNQTQVEYIDLKQLDLKIMKVLNESFMFERKTQKIRLMTVSSKKYIQKSHKKIPQKSSITNIAKQTTKSIFYQKSSKSIPAFNSSRSTLNSPLKTSFRKSKPSLLIQDDDLNDLKNNQATSNNDQLDQDECIDNERQVNLNKFISKKLRQRKKNTFFDKQNQRSSISMHTMRNNFQQRILSRFKPQDRESQKLLQTGKLNSPIVQNTIKKKIKKQVFIKQNLFQQTKQQPQPLQVSPQKRQIIKYFENNGKDIAIDQQGHKNAFNKVKQQIQQQNPDLLLDETMNEYLKQKKFQQQQAFFKNMTQWIKPLVDDINISLQKCGQNKKKLLPRRYKNLCKILSQVYTKAYQLFQKNEKIYSLVNPLFQYFEIGYGIMKKYHLYSRMTTFLSQILLYKDEYHIFYSFFFFVGIQNQNVLSQKISSSDVHLYLKLLRSLSLGFSMPINILNIYTSNVILFQNTKEILLQQKIHINIVEKVLNKVHEKLQNLTGVDLRPRKGSNTQLIYPKNTDKTFNRPEMEFEQIKLDVFKCTQLVMEEIIKIKLSIEQSYSQLIEYVYEDALKDRVDQSLIRFIVKCQFCTKSEQFKFSQFLKNMFYLSSLYYQYKKVDGKSQKSIKTLKTIRTFKQLQINTKTFLGNNERQTLSMSDMCNFFLQNNILDFNRTFFNCLYKFKLRQQGAYTMAISNLVKIRQYIKQNSKYSVERIMLQEIQKNLQSPSPTHKLIFSKRLLVLINLRVIEDEVDELVNYVIGKEIGYLNNQVTISQN